MTLREKQTRFCEAIGRLIAFAFSHPGWELTFADGSVDLVRKYRDENGTIHQGEDAQHMKESLHYSRLAQDFNLFVGDRWITNGDHPAWAELGRYWEGLHGLARWGGRFGTVDSNHFSFEHEGRK